MEEFYILTDHARERLALRSEIKEEWIEATVMNPDLISPHKNADYKQYVYKKIEEFDNRVLKVVASREGPPYIIYTLHFERSMKGKL